MKFHSKSIKIRRTQGTKFLSQDRDEKIESKLEKSTFTLRVTKRAQCPTNIVNLIEIQWSNSYMFGNNSELFEGSSIVFQILKTIFSPFVPFPILQSYLH